MRNKNVIIYWVATIWLSLGMTVTGITQLFQMEEVVQNMNSLGYPPYFLTIIGSWKIAGIIAILMPKFLLVKEWADAGFFFLMSGAIFSHLAMGDPLTEYFGPVLLLTLTIISWYWRPSHKKIQLIEDENDNKSTR